MNKAVKRSALNIAFALSSLCLGARGLNAGEPNGKAVANRIYAQTLVNALIAGRSDLMIVGLHGTASGAKDEAMIACNLDHIGNSDTAFDIAAGREHMTILEPKTPEKFEICMPLKDASGGYIGAIVMIFKRTAGDTEPSLYLKALELRDGLATRIPNFAALFDAAK